MQEKERLQRQAADEQKKMYRDTLNHQAAMNELNRANYGKMT
jgi:hypothetical protein